MQKEAPYLLFICPSPKKYRLLLKQLSQEGWVIACVASLKRAIEILSKKKVTAAFLSLNLSDSPLKIAMLLGKEFQTPCFIFPEDTNYKSAKFFKETSWPYIFTTALSAPLLKTKVKALLDQSDQVISNHIDPEIDVRRDELPTKIKYVSSVPDEASIQRFEEEEVLSGSVKKALQKVLSDVFKGASSTSHANETTDSIYLILIQQGEFKHLIMIGTTHDFSVESGVIGKCFKLLKDQLKIEEVRFHHVIRTDMKVDLKLWAQQNGDYFFDRTYDGKTVFITGKNYTDLLPTMKHANPPDAFAVDLKHIPVEVPLCSDVYLYLTLSNKLIKYVAEGNYLSVEQKQKLIDKEIEYLHIKNEDLIKMQDFFIEYEVKTDLATHLIDPVKVG